MSVPGFACGNLILQDEVFPEVRATNTGFLNAGSTSHTVPLPASLVAGELLIIGLACQYNVTPTFGTPLGWSVLLANTRNGALQGAQAWFYKVSNGAEGASVTVTSTALCRAAYNSYAIRNQHISQAPVALAVADSGTGTAPNPPSLTPSWGQAKNLWLVAASMSHANVPTDYPDDFTDAISANASTANGATLASARRLFEGTNQDPNTFTITSSRWVAVTIAIRGKGPVAPSRILDGYSNVTGAWSLSRQLLSSFTGARYTTNVGVDRVYEQKGAVPNSDLIEGTPANQPLLVTAGPQNRTALQFDGSNDILETDDSVSSYITAAAGYIVCCGVVRDITTNSGSIQSNDADFGSSGSGGAFMALKNNLGAQSVVVYNNDGSPDTVSISASVIDSVAVFEWRHEGGTLYLRVTLQGNSPDA